jgi:hypothetical protein
MAKDIFHNAVRNALIKDGWTITDDPFRLENKEKRMAYEADIGAEKMLAAEKGLDKIVVEVKSFLKLSLANEFHTILGQYMTYIDALEFLSLDRELIIAVPKFAEERIQEYPFILHLIEKHCY